MVIRLNSYTRLQVSLEQVNLISKTIQLDDDNPRIAALAAKVRDVRDYLTRILVPVVAALPEGTAGV